MRYEMIMFAPLLSAVLVCLCGRGDEVGGRVQY